MTGQVTFRKVTGASLQTLLMKRSRGRYAGFSKYADLMTAIGNLKPEEGLVIDVPADEDGDVFRARVGNMAYKRFTGLVTVNLIAEENAVVFRRLASKAFRR